MNHFNIILSLCRASMKTPTPALKSHIERLAKALHKNGDDDEARSLRQILNGSHAEEGLIPSKVTLSKKQNTLERLTPSVKPPVDKEAGVPLANIVFPDSQKEGVKPHFSHQISHSISALTEEWAHIDELMESGIPPAFSIMLYGRPGTGKTMLAHYFASQIGLPIVVAKLDGLISSYLGTTARNISNLFSFANRYQCILLLDEFDAVAKLRDDPQELGEIKRVVNTLLQCIDERSEFGFTIAITNHELLLDPAIWRRFDVRIETPPPEAETRLQIINDLYPEERHSARNRFIAWLSDGTTGSEIEKLINFIVRQKIIKKGDYDFFTSIQHYLNLSAHEQRSHNKELAKGPPDKLAVALSNDINLPFNQEQLALLFSNTQSTISRWLSKEVHSAETTEITHA